MANLIWVKLSEEVRKVGFKKSTIKTFRQPNGAVEEYTTWYVPGQDGAATIAITKDNKVVIARQYRPGPERVLDELPGGYLDDGDDYAAAAARELKEETGYVSDESLVYLGQVCRDAYKNGTDHYFLATGCYLAAEQELEATEFIEIDTISIDQLIENAKTANMSDAAAVLMAYERLKELQKQPATLH